MSDPFPKLDVPRKLELTETQRLATILGIIDESVDPRRILVILEYWYLERAKK